MLMVLPMEKTAGNEGTLSQRRKARAFPPGIDRFCPLAGIGRQLYDKYALTAPEREFIESMIKPMG